MFGSTGDNGASAITLFGEGDDKVLYLAGSTDSPLQGQTEVGLWDGFVSKYDTDGNERWTRQFGMPGDEFTTGIAADATGVYVSGHTDAAFSGQTLLGYQDAFVRKYDHDGNGAVDASVRHGRRRLCQRRRPQRDANRLGNLRGGGHGGARSLDHPLACGMPLCAPTTATAVELWTRQFGTSHWTTACSALAPTAASDAPGVYLTGYVEGALPGQSL